MDTRRAARSLVLLAGSLLTAACVDSSSDDDPAPTAPATTTTAATPTVVATTANPEPVQLKLETVLTGLARPTLVTNAGDGSNRLFVLEKSGIIRIVQQGRLDGAPFLDITDITRSSGNEQGLLGLAFHPKFKENGRFFVAYTAQNSDNTVAEYRVAANGRGDASTGRILLAVKDQYPNHNGGMLAFGKDGFLYISMGDGGSAGDPQGNGQNLDSLLGKLLRIDVDSGSPYGIPRDNPFVSRSGARPEIWAYGLRNPWRFSFDRQTGDLWIGDVGQNKWEEIDFQPAASKGGENYGWRTMEGAHCYSPASGCEQQGLVLPVAEYDHGSGCSVTGGYVYRGKAHPAMAGTYYFTDYCSGNLWQVRRDPAGKATVTQLDKVAGSISAFGADEAGELYVVTDQSGALLRLVPK